MRIKGGTDRVSKSNSYYGEIAKASVKKDFQKSQKKPEPVKIRVDDPPAEDAQRRIIQIKENGEYSKYARFIVGKLVKLKRKSMFGNSWYCEFVFEEDRKALNRAAGWSDNKKEYLFDGLKFK